MFCTAWQGLFSPPDPSPGSAFSEGIKARDELLKDLSELVRQREERMDVKRASGTGMHKSVMEYILEDMRTWVSLKHAQLTWRLCIPYALPASTGAQLPPGDHVGGG